MVFLNSTMIMFIKLVAEEKFEDTKGLTRSYKLKDRQYNGQKKNDKRTNNDLQNITQNTKNRTTPAVNSCVPPGGLAVPALHVAPVVLLLL